MQRILIAKEDGLVLLEVTLDPSRSYTLGRSSGAAIRLDASSISRLHAVLFAHDGEWVICDLGSTRGLWTQAGREHTVQLANEEWVAIGPAYIWYEGTCQTQEERSLPIKSALEDSAITEHILLVEGPDPMCPQAIALDQRQSITIGTGSACDVVVGASDLEPLHLSVFPFRNGWQATSIGESDLLQPDGFPARTTPLEPENTVFAGSLSLSMLTVRRFSKLREEAEESGLDHVNEHVILPAVDLEAAARRGRTDPPERPAAA